MEKTLAHNEPKEPVGGDGKKVLIDDVWRYWREFRDLLIVNDMLRLPIKSKEWKHLGQKIMKNMVKMNEKEITEILMVPYLLVQIEPKKNGDRPVLWLPSAQEAFDGMEQYDMIDWIGFASALLELKVFDPRVVAVGFYNVDIKSKDFRQHCQSIGLQACDLEPGTTILQSSLVNYLQSTLGTKPCDSLMYFHTDTLVREWPPQQEALLQLYGATKVLSSKQKK